MGRLTNFLFVRCPSQSLLCVRSSPVALTAASAWAAQRVSPQDSLGCSPTSLVASACLAPVRVAWGGQTLVPWRSQGLACSGWPGDVCWEPHPVRLSFMGC